VTHKIEQLVPKLELPKCEHEITDDKVLGFRRYCGNYTAKYRIDGKSLCKLHARQLALDILIKEGRP